MVSVERSVQSTLEVVAFDRRAPRVAVSRIAWRRKLNAVHRQLRGGAIFEPGSQLLEDAMLVLDAAKPHPRRYPYTHASAARAAIAWVLANLQMIDLAPIDEEALLP